jgi:hypothetical protein
MPFERSGAIFFYAKELDKGQPIEMPTLIPVTKIMHKIWPPAFLSAIWYPKTEQ